MKNIDVSKRFDGRSDLYVKYRPGYPKSALDYITQKIGICSDSVVADVGAGTGIFSASVCKISKTVYSVEPNAEMMAKAKQSLTKFDNCHFVEAYAENTMLPDASVDFVTAAQAFHWFNKPRCKTEFKRILKPGGRVVLIWNSRSLIKGLNEAYEELLCNYCADYKKVTMDNISEGDIADFLGDYKSAVFDNVQKFDFEGFKGRALSSSYSPVEGQPCHQLFITGLKCIFEKYSQNGQILFNYKTNIRWSEF